MVSARELAKVVIAIAMAVSAYYSGQVPQQETTSAVVTELSRVSMAYAECLSEKE